jgi:S-(hydroxymethyl)glutathione dehydrogenase / alcohol dehydrogenase
MFEGKVISCKAAVAWAAGEELKIETIQVDPPKAGEVRVKIAATGLVSGEMFAVNFMSKITDIAVV